MPDNIGPEVYRSEIAALNNEIYRLTRQLEQQEQERLFSCGIKPDDPFGNPTEYHEYNADYSRILPEINAPGAEIPLEPDSEERRRLRRSYSIGGWCLLLQFFTVSAVSMGLSLLIQIILINVNGAWTSSEAYSYMRSTSIVAAINMVSYLTANTTFGLLGLKWLRTDTSTLTKSRDLTAGRVVMYCLIAAFLRMVSIYAADAAEQIFSKFGTTTYTRDLSDLAQNGVGTAIMLVYTCIIAPVTEELFFRGMLLRTFSRANQRFAVFATAFFFGLSHGNVPQFLLAFFVGIFLAHITLKHGSIVPAVIVHIFLNTLTNSISQAVDIFGESAELVLVLTQILLMSLGMVLLLIFRADNKLPATTPAQTRRGFVIARTSLPVVAVTAMMLTEAVAAIFEASA